MFTNEAKKLIKQMYENGHTNITIRVYPEDNNYCLSSEWNIDKTKKPQR